MPERNVSRRGLIGGTAGVAGVAAGFAGGAWYGDEGARSDAALAGRTPATYPFRGEHQAGIVTPAQDRLHFAAFDVTTRSRGRLVSLLQAWTAAADRMTQGLPAGPVGPTEGAPLAPPDDTGEAIGLSPGGLTLTFGFGPGVFRDEHGRDRFGLADRQPEALRDLPHFPADQLDPARSRGDICVQACSEDPQVAVHAIRNLARIGFGTVAVRWSQLGFGRTSTTSTSQTTPRNLFGFKDGTLNVKAEQTDDLERYVWVGPDDDQAWLAGGSYLVARRINMHIETWDRQGLQPQEEVIGRTKGSGAPLSGGTELTPLDLTSKGSSGPLIPIDSHVSVVSPERNDGVRMLRRGYNFVDGSNPLGGLDAGLFFIAYVRDPRTHFIPLQTKMASNDAMMEYLQFTGSAIFAVPAGTQPGQYVGQALFT
ncbi:MAG TPA: iron uptake transporter deferrochelatase/peroxidase subunit [Nocardioides sp.]|nr:iron uptake transporter deferrochelatase/peroxidase subunit [Nocardioides sp.]